MEWTNEDDIHTLQMSVECPLCPVCKDSGFYMDYYVNPPERKQCENCNGQS